MSEEDEPVSAKLCEAYREAIKSEIDGIKNTIIASVSLSTAIITVLMYILEVVAK